MLSASPIRIAALRHKDDPLPLRATVEPENQIADSRGQALFGALHPPQVQQNLMRARAELGIKHVSHAPAGQIG